MYVSVSTRPSGGMPDRNLHQLLQVVAPDVKFRSLYLGEPQLHGVLHKVFVSTYDESCIVNEQEEFDRFECRDHGIGQATVEVVDEHYEGLNSCFLKELTEISSEFSYITAHSIGLLRRRLFYQLLRLLQVNVLRVQVLYRSTCSA